MATQDHILLQSLWHFLLQLDSATDHQLLCPWTVFTDCGSSVCLIGPTNYTIQTQSKIEK